MSTLATDYDEYLKNTLAQALGWGDFSKCSPAQTELFAEAAKLVGLDALGNPRIRPELFEGANVPVESALPMAHEGDRLRVRANKDAGEIYAAFVHVSEAAKPDHNISVRIERTPSGWLVENDGHFKVYVGDKARSLDKRMDST